MYQENKENNHPRILVIGDIMIDEYIIGDVYRVSPEAPVPVVLKRRSEYSIGGAGNVAKNVVSLGAKCSICSIVGKDENANRLSEHLMEIGIDSVLFRCQDRPTTLKTRIMGNGHQITRIDSESDLPIPKDIANDILSHFELIENGEFDTVIFQDYGKGMLTVDLVSSAIKILKPKVSKILVDPKPDTVERYVGVSLIKPNLLEFKRIVGISDSSSLSVEEIDLIAKKWLKENPITDSLLITLSGDGMIYVRPDSDYIYSPGYTIPVSDVSGAGDSVIAALSVFLGRPGIQDSKSVELSNLSGSIACQYPGPYSVTLEELLSTYDRVRKSEAQSS